MLSKMDPALAAIIGASVAALGALLASLINASIQLRNTRENHQHQLKLDQQNHQHQLKLEQLKQRSEGARGAASVLREKYELAHQILTNVRAENSHSTLVLMTVGEPPKTDHYRRNAEHFSQLEMLAGLYIPSMVSAVNSLRSSVSDFQFDLHFSLPKKEEDPERYEKMYKKLSDLSDVIGSKANQAKRIVEQQSVDLFSQTQGQEPQQG